MRTIPITLLLWYLLPANTTFAYTHADTLRGSNGTGRAWWDVMHYDLQVSFDTANRSIAGVNNISFAVIKTPGDSMQIDLQSPMILDSMVLQEPTPGERNQKLDIVKQGNVWWAKYPF